MEMKDELRIEERVRGGEKKRTRGGGSSRFHFSILSLVFVLYYYTHLLILIN